MEAGKGGKQVVYPKYRKQFYTEFRACERFGMNPLDFPKIDIVDQLTLLAYEQIRQHEEHEERMNMYKLQGYKG